MPAAVCLIAVKTVVVADDTAFVRDRFSSAIENAGHRAIAVRTGPELLAALRAERGAIDLIVLDLRLPHGSGIELLRGIQRAGGQPPKILVFSGTIAHADEVRELEALGVVGYLNEYTSVHHIVPTLGPHLFPQHYNRRSSPRVTLNTALTLRVANNITSAFTLNISKGGLAIRTANPLECGTEVKIRFRLPGGKTEVEAEGRIAWADRRVGMGIQFTRISAADESAVACFVDAHFFSNRKA